MARRVVVSGRVQGVFFRDACRAEAERLGAAGWVRNRPDGRVEALVEGDAAAVDALVAWMGRGPREAVVVSRTVTEASPEGGARFEVR